MKTIVLSTLFLFLPVSVYADDFSSTSLYYENSAFGSQGSLQSGGIERRSNAPESLYLLAGVIHTRIDNLTMYTGETDYSDTYLYYGVRGPWKASPYINYGMDIGSLMSYLVTASLFGCESGCMPRGSRFLTVGIQYSGSSYEIDIYRRQYLLVSNITDTQRSVIGIRYSLKF